ncbi:MAG: protein-S-isoprenylcysteine methyltransferase, partial [Alphaproteobacteria bacterium]
MDLLDHALYAAAWASFGIVHSLLAREWIKGHLGRVLGPAYRLVYNALA